MKNVFEGLRRSASAKQAESPRVVEKEVRRRGKVKVQSLASSARTAANYSKTE